MATLASKLVAVMKAESSKKEELSAEFSRIIEGHPEEKLLRDCLMQAKLNRGFLDFGRAFFMPEALKDEGFHIEMAGPGFHLHFD